MKLRSSAGMGEIITPASAILHVPDVFHRYLRLPAFLNPEDVHALLTRSKLLIESFSLEDHPLVRSFHHNSVLDPLIR